MTIQKRPTAPLHVATPRALALRRSACPAEGTGAAAFRGAGLPAPGNKAGSKLPWHWGKFRFRLTPGGLLGAQYAPINVADLLLGFPESPGEVFLATDQAPAPREVFNQFRVAGAFGQSSGGLAGDEADGMIH